MRANPRSFKGNRKIRDPQIDIDATKADAAYLDFEEKKKLMSPEERRKIDNGKITEAVFTEGILSGHIFGEGAEIAIPSLYDDYFRHIDLAVVAGPKREKENDDEIDRELFGLGIDFSSTAQEACKKLSSTLVHTILKGYAPSLKYSDLPGYGKNINTWIAKVIIGADQDSVADFADTLANSIKTELGKSVKEIARETLKNHPISNIIIDEITTQLVAFRNIAYAVNNKDAGKLYHRAYVLFRSLLEEQNIDMEKVRSSRRGDKIASGLYSMIGKMSDPDKKMAPEDFQRHLIELGKMGDFKNV